MLSWIGMIIAWVAGIVVLVKLFQKEGILKGILGLICMLYTFIWGWMNFKKEELQLKTWMYVWTAAIILGIILSLLGSGGN
ncbi:MAG: hypothetical protein AB1894_19885 [Chloroflexota bacterium]